MVLYYGLLALETANNTVAATTSACQRESISKKSKPSEQMSSSSNSWIYTADLRKRFEERYGDYRYIFVPVYIDGKPSRHNSNSTAIIPQKFDNENSWIYSRPFYDHLFNSTSKMSSSTCYVTNQAFMRDELPKKTSKKNFFQRSSSVKNKSTTSLSPTFYLTKHRTNDVVEEDDDENPENENHLIPLIKHNSVISSHATTESSNDNPILVNTTINNELKNTKSNTKHVTTHNNTLTRLRSFFFKSSSTLVGTQE